MVEVKSAYLAAGPSFESQPRLACLGPVCKSECQTCVDDSGESRRRKVGEVDLNMKGVFNTAVEAEMPL